MVNPTHDDLIRLMEAWVPLVSSGLGCPAAGTAMHRAKVALSASQTALRAAEAENARLRELLAGAVSRAAVVDRCVTWERRALERAELYPDDETHEATASTAGSLAAEFRALPALAQPEGGSDG